MTPRYFMTAVPASVVNDPIGYAFSIFGLCMISVLSFARLWSIATNLTVDRHSWRDPVTLTRIMGLCLALTIFLLATPEAVLNMMWKEITPAERFDLALTRRIFEGIAVVPAIINFLLATYSGLLVETQLKREPIPYNLLPSFRQLMRMALTVALVAFIAIVLAFHR